ncbi:putative quinol monooxygenase [Roseateles sp. DC23W]|uniref:Quinol monooxygenase n=1 Tax=Pelomonas dachongensis TaxID=3299029 RepID=A0ABW7ESU4_9BURK
MYGLMGSLKAAEGRRPELIQLLLAESGDMPGCLSYVVAEDPADELTVWVTEVWKDAAAHKASLQLPGVKAVIARARPLIANFGEYRETRPVGGHGLAD